MFLERSETRKAMDRGSGSENVNRHQQVRLLFFWVISTDGLYTRMNVIESSERLNDRSDADS